jgi:hypothetical protein
LGHWFDFSWGKWLYFPFFVFALSGVRRGLAIAQVAVVVSEVDSEWKRARSANPNVLLSKKKERKRFIGKRSLETPRIISYDDIMTDVSEVGFGDGTWVDLAQDLVHWQALLFEVLNLRLLSQNNH